MTQVKKLDFTGATIFCGIDVHKKNWRVNIQDSEFELEDFSQNADPVLLHKHVNRKYPGATVKVCYEAGFSGFSAQRWLTKHGIDCRIVNAADVATTDKEKRQKTDKIDARKLCEHLQTKKMKGIYVPASNWEHGRSLVRARARIVSNQTRCKNRIWQLLHFSGLALPKDYEAGQYWSRSFVKELLATDCGSEELKITLGLYMKDFVQTRSLLVEATRAVRQLCKQPEYQKDMVLLRSIPGIGEINTAVILFELQAASRLSALIICAVM